MPFGASGSDYYNIASWVPAPDYTNTNGRTPLTRAALATLLTRSPGIYVGGGQSNCVNVLPSTFTTTNPTKIFQLSILDGAVYPAQDPLLGPGLNHGSILTQIADGMITAGTHPYVIVVPMAMSGVGFQRFAVGGDTNARIVAACRRMNNVGMVATRILWQGGETDNVNGDSAATVTANLQSIRSTFVANGQTAKFLIAIASWFAGATSSNVTTGENNAVNGTTIFAGPNTDALNGSYRFDNTHFNDTGGTQVAALWRTAIAAS